MKDLTNSRRKRIKKIIRGFPDYFLLTSIIFEIYLTCQLFINYISVNNTKLDFIINSSKFYNALSKRLDAWLGWLGFSDFIVLYYLSKAPQEKLRRIDLADKVWMTASWITRLLAPMEKIWLINKESNNEDARVSIVSLASWWKIKLEEAIDRLWLYLDEIIDETLISKVQESTKLFEQIGSKIMWR